MWLRTVTFVKSQRKRKTVKNASSCISKVLQAGSNDKHIFFHEEERITQGRTKIPEDGDQNHGKSFSGGRWTEF